MSPAKPRPYKDESVKLPLFAVAQNVHVGDAWCGDAGA